MPATNVPAVGLVTVLFNSSQVLDDFMDSVTAQDYPNLRLYFIDNASSDKGLDRVRERQQENWTLIPNSENLGVAEGNNQGIAAAMADGVEWILLVNNDTVFGPTFVTDLVMRSLGAGREVVSPLIAATEPEGTIWYAGGHFRRREGFLTTHERMGNLLETEPRSPIRTEYAPTCALLVARSVFERVGTMDKTFFVYFDDTDFMMRLSLAGIPVWVDRGVTFTHKASTLTGGELSQFGLFWASRNWILMIRKYSQSRLRQAFYYAYIAAWLAGRTILRLDNLAAARRRLEGFKAGLKIQLPTDADAPVSARRRSGVR